MREEPPFCAAILRETLRTTTPRGKSSPWKKRASGLQLPETLWMFAFWSGANYLGAIKKSTTGKIYLREPNGFKRELLLTHGLNEAGFQKLWDEVRGYRDSFVAHTEEYDLTKVPCMTTPFLLVCFYYRGMRRDFQELQSIDGLPDDMCKYFDAHLKEAEGIFQLSKDTASVACAVRTK